MRATTTQATFKNLGLAVAAVGAAILLVIAWLAMAVNASAIVQVSSNIADVPAGANLVLTVGTQNDGDIHELEIDHSLEAVLPEFSVYANENNPYGGSTCGPDDDIDCETAFAAMGVTATYSAAASQWTIDFGSDVSDTIVDNGGDINFYFTLRNAAGEILWGSMDPTTPENTFGFDLLVGTGDSLVPELVDEADTGEVETGADADEVIVPGVPNTSLGR